MLILADIMGVKSVGSLHVRQAHNALFHMVDHVVYTPVIVGVAASEASDILLARFWRVGENTAVQAFCSAQVDEAKEAIID